MKHFSLFKSLAILTSWLFISPMLMAQTNPTPHNLSESNFVFNGFENGDITTYPTSTQGWSFSGEPNESTVASPAADRILSESSAFATSGNIKNEVENGISFLNSSSNHIGALAIALNTTDLQNI